MDERSFLSSFDVWPVLCFSSLVGKVTAVFPSLDYSNVVPIPVMWRSRLGDAFVELTQSLVSAHY